MSGPRDTPDDPDEVTLWAGRLRAWPVAPEAGEHDDTVRVERTPVGRRGSTAAADPGPPGDDTAHSAGRRRVDAPGVEPADEDTAPSAARSEAGVADIEPIDDDTVLSGARAPLAVADEERDDDGTPGDTATVRRARGAAPGGATRAADARDEDAAERASRTPEIGRTETYAPRADGVVRVTRTPPPSRHPDAADAATVRRRSQRGQGVRVLVVAVSLVVLAAAAVAAFVLLIG